MLENKFGAADGSQIKVLKRTFHSYLIISAPGSNWRLNWLITFEYKFASFAVYTLSNFHHESQLWWTHWVVQIIGWSLSFACVQSHWWRGTLLQVLWFGEWRSPTSRSPVWVPVVFMPSGNVQGSLHKTFRTWCFGCTTLVSFFGLWKVRWTNEVRFQCSMHYWGFWTMASQRNQEFWISLENKFEILDDLKHRLNGKELVHRNKHQLNA